MFVARVLTDVAGIDKEFDYLVPPPMEGALAVGDEVRVQLGPRRVGGWVTALREEALAGDSDADGPGRGGPGRGGPARGGRASGRVASEGGFVPLQAPLDLGGARAGDLEGQAVGGEGAGPVGAPGYTLRPIAKRRGAGPEPEVVDLAGWAAWRWATRRAAFLTAASPDWAATRPPSPALRRPAAPTRVPLETGLPLTAGVHILRLPPAGDPTPIAAAAAQLGPTLIVVPTHARAEVLAARLRRAGGDVALLPGDWEQARAGAAVVIGARAAAWGPCPDLAAVLVVDGHDEGLAQEGAPSWNALTVAAERAERAGAPCLVTSACPTPELLALGDLHTVEHGAERRGWATFEVVDRRGDDPRLGLYSPRLVNLVRDSGGRVACILNRVGRVRLLACGACGELVRCEECGAAMSSPVAGELVCPNGHGRPAVCARCDSLRLKALRIGVARAREDLENLAGRRVGEVTGTTKVVPDAEVLIGTEALLHRLDPAAGITAVAFVDFDRELLAPRIRAADEALALLAHASRLVRGSMGRVVVQTRLPEQPTIRAAVAGDPSIASDAQLATRRALRLPPFSSLAVIYGEAASEYIAALRAAGGDELEVTGPAADRWMVKADDHHRLCDALARVDRPGGGTVRVAVDPARI